MVSVLIQIETYDMAHKIIFNFKTVILNILEIWTITINPHSFLTIIISMAEIL